MNRLKFTHTIICLTSILLILSSCKKDPINQETTSDKISKLEIVKLQASSGFSNTIDLKYDEQNRLIEFGLDKFSYNTQGKVEKRSLFDADNKLISEYGYRWDTEGRLAEIRLNYYHSDENISGINIAENKPIIAKFEYQNNQHNPSKLIWRTINMGYSGGSIKTTLSAEKTMRYFYEGENLSHAIYSGSSDILTGNPSAGTYANIEAHFFFKPGDKPHFLKKLYDQLGFNPIDFSDIIPSKQPIQNIIYVFKYQGTLFEPDWEKASNYEIAYDKLDRPTLVSINQNIIGLSSIYPDINKLSLVYKITY